LYDLSQPPDGALDGTITVLDSTAIRSSVGVSLLWRSPFGPLRFDYAHVLSKQPFDDTQSFRFGGGTQF
jgi:outer membrane protein insertion porin family